MIGDDEADRGQVTLKRLRGASEQETLSQADAAGRLGKPLRFELMLKAVRRSP